MMHVNNQSAIAVAKNPEHHGWMKHLNLHYYWLCNAVYDGKIKIIHVPTAEMAVDILTKPLKKDLVVAGRLILGIRS